jgi:hypothetical protein
VNLADDELAWELRADGTWSKVERVEGVNTHVALRQLAQARAGKRDQDPNAPGR